MSLPITHNWWIPFFVDFWPHLQNIGVDDARILQEVDQIERKLSLSAGARVLDVPCGRGRHATELAQRGYAVTGVDISTPLLDQAKKRAEKAKVVLDLHARDMRDLPWLGEFDGAYCYRTSIGYFGDDDCEFLSAIAACLRPGARLLVETALVETILPRFIERSWSRFSNGYVLEHRKFHPESTILEVEWTQISHDGSICSATSFIRVYSCREMIDLLRKAGFVDISLTQELGDEPFETLGSRATFVAMRG